MNHAKGVASVDIYPFHASIGTAMNQVKDIYPFPRLDWQRCLQRDLGLKEKGIIIKISSKLHAGFDTIAP